MPFFETWILKPEYLPAWLQAFSAIIALGISVWSVVWTGSITRRRNRLEIRGLASAIYPEMDTLKKETRRVRDVIVQIHKQDSHLVGSAIAGGLQIFAHISFPPMLERNIDKLFILGDDAGVCCLQLVRLIFEHQAKVADIASRIVTMNQGQWPAVVDDLQKQLDLLDKSIEACTYKIQKLIKTSKKQSHLE